MEARLKRIALALVAVSLCGADYRTQNFLVTAGSAEMAKAVGDAAERYREELAVSWLGKPLAPWTQPCPIRVDCAPQLGAGGSTSFIFDRGEVFGWDMQIQGPPDRLLDSVLPHEVTHAVFATHFRQPLPRWADEGACTTVEHDAERNKQRRMLIDFLQTNRGIAFSKMFAMREYPPDILPLYSQGHSLASFLIDQGGRRKFIDFVGDGLKQRAWSQTVKAHYGYENLGHLQTTWLEWVRQSSPLPVPVALRGAPSDVQLATNNAPAQEDVIYRGQSADPAPADDNRPSVYERRAPRAAAPGAPATHATADEAWQPSPAPVAPPTGEVASAPAAGAGAGVGAESGSVYARRSPPAANGKRPVRVSPPRPPRQTILEWSRDEASAQAPPAQRGVEPPGVPVYYDAAVRDLAPIRR